MSPQPASRPARPPKVVVTGPAGAGTTTFVTTLAPATVVSKGRGPAGLATTDPAVPVSMDFARLVVDRDLVLHLLGSAGPPPAAVRPFLSDGVLGRIVLVDGGRDGEARDAEPIFQWLRTEPAVPYVVGVTKAWSNPAAAVDGVRRRLAVPDGIAVTAVDVRQADSARSLLLTLLQTVLAQVEAGGSTPVAASA